VADRQQKGTANHAPDLDRWPVVGSDIDLAVFRAQPINSSANGLRVRFLTVMMATANRSAGNFTGSIFSPIRRALNCATDWRQHEN